MSGSELSVECELRNRKNQAAYLLADNRPTKSRRGFLPFRNLQIHLNKLAQQVKLLSLYGNSPFEETIFIDVDTLFIALEIVFLLWNTTCIRFCKWMVYI